ncbi:MAG: hypothetical protein CVU87_04815 [Firmicutes bacterium HGW-Firmicutes-12]|jgi:hypothetical protein|nr:MAG: hypothetical protein CVU87_04815 [Firmicutes bacterium HGW-Firmicutes-12]
MNEITDINTVGGLINLIELFIVDNPIKDYTTALDLPNLDEQSREEIDYLVKGNWDGRINRSFH